MKEMNVLSNYENQGFAELFKSFSLADNTKNIKNTKNKNIMQTIKNLLTIVLVGFVTFANANNNPSEVPTANFKKTDNEKIRLTLSQSEKANLVIEDAAGIIIYDESIKSNNAVAKDYDLTTLADGTYTFSVELSDKIIEQNVTITKGNTTLGNTNMVSKPVFFETENAVFVTIEGLSNATVEVRIFDDLDTEIYQVEKQNIDKLNTKYDMSRLENSAYTMAVTINGKTYYETINLK